MPKYTTELVPTMPLPHAPAPAPAPVADAATGEIEAKLTVALTLAMVERVRRASAVQVRKDALDLIEDWNILNLANAKLRDRAEAAEAERDRLALEVAALRGALSPFATSANRYGLSGDNDVLDYPVNSHSGLIYRDLLNAAAALSPTPPAAEAVTGGEPSDWLSGNGAWLEPAALDQPQEA